MEKINYQKETEKIISEISAAPENARQKPALLLHACCGPCSSYVIEYLASIFDITVYYYNPNIHPEAEYSRRLEELKTFLKKFPPAVQENVKLVVDEYNQEDYFSATNVLNETELQKEPEKGERCFRCYEFRMRRSWNYAVKNNFQWFTTTLSISPHKDSQKINLIGKKLETLSGSPATKFLYSDFKKKGGFLRSTQLTAQFNMWRQNYCGCVYSKQNSKGLADEND